MISFMNYPSEDKENPPKNKGKPNNKNNNKREIKPPKKISEKYLYNSGLAYLQRFPASSAHFKTVMMRKIDRSCRHHIEQDREKCGNWLNELVIKFQDLTLLDDTAYLKGMVTSLRRRGQSTRQIDMKLSQKGLDRESITKTIKAFDKEELNDDEDNDGDYRAALIFARKKRLGPYDKLGRHSPEKTIGSFARAGYSFDIAKKIIALSIDEDEKN